MRADYISRQAAIDGLKEYFYDEERTETEAGAYWHHIHVLQFLEDIPPADVRPVVLCNDCRYANRTDLFELWCNGFCHPARLVHPDDFCSHGEARY